MKPKSKITLIRCSYLATAVNLLILPVMICLASTELDVPVRSIGMQQAATEVKLEFRPTQAASGRTTEGSRFSLQLYEASDGVAISSRLDRFRSARRARTALAKIIRKGRVLERKPKLDGTGHPIGERVVLKFTRSKSQLPQTELLWIDNTDLHQIVSSSLYHILEFERQFYP